MPVGVAQPSRKSFQAVSARAALLQQRRSPLSEVGVSIDRGVARSNLWTADKARAIACFFGFGRRLVERAVVEFWHVGANGAAVDARGGYSYENLAVEARVLRFEGLVQGLPVRFFPVQAITCSAAFVQARSARAHALLLLCCAHVLLLSPARKILGQPRHAN